MKRIYALMLALTLLLTLLAGCGGSPADTTVDTPETPAQTGTDNQPETPENHETDEYQTADVFPLCEPGEITVSWLAGDKTNQVLERMESDFSQNLFYQNLEKLSGVHIDWTIIPTATYNEQFSLMLVSEEYPDIATNSASKCSGSADQACEDGILVDLNEYKDLIPNYLNVLENVAIGGYGGHLTDAGYLMGFWQLRDRLQPTFLGYYTRQDWMDELNLDAPETLDDWHEMLVAFRDNKTGGKAPWLIGSTTGIPAFNWISRAFGVNTTAPYMVQRDGVVACSVAEDGYRDFLTMMADWYAEKLIYQDFPTNVDNSTMNAMLDANEIGVWMTLFRMGGTYFHDNFGICEDSFYAQKLKHPTQEAGGTNPVGDHGSLQGAAFGDPSGALIFAEGDHVRECISMLDYIYSEQGILESNWGFETVTFTYDENGKPQYMDWMSDPDRGTNRELYLIHSRPKLDLMDGIEAGYGEDALDYYEYWNDEGEWNMPNVTFTVEEGEERSGIQSNIQTYVEEFSSKVIANQITLDDAAWEKYLRDLDGMGLARLVEINQTALDRFLARMDAK